MANAAVLKLEEIPQILRAKQLKDWTAKDRKFIAGMMLIKELVQTSYQKQSRIMQATIQKKREYGYCGGFVYCLEYTGKHYMCSKCKSQKANPKYHRRQSQYGKIRAEERKRLKAQKDADSLS